MSTTAIVSNELQGIGSVLGSSEIQRSKTAASLRRTLSADMSSRKWLSKNGFCPLKRIASSEEFQTITSVTEGKEDEPPGQTDIWSKIVSQKSVSLPTPYVHPLAKRSRSLSQQSLEICTESLGSETGSDGFSSAPPSHTSDEELEQGIGEEVEEEEEEIAAVVYKQEFGAVNYSSHNSVKKSLPRSFPPPLPSLSQSGLHMRSHRVYGRLVVEAVPVPAPPQNYFQAQREGGRLLLTLANPQSTDIENIIEEEMFQEMEDEEVEEEEEEENEQYVDDKEVILAERTINVSPEDQPELQCLWKSQPRKRLPTGVISVHRSAIMVNKLIGLTNVDPTWSPKLEKLGDGQTPLAQSLPPFVSRLVPSSTAASSFNTYDYCWRTKSVAAPPTVCTQNPHPINKNINPNHQNYQEMVLMKGDKADYLVPVFKGCKEPKRSLFIWEAPHCITTS